MADVTISGLTNRQPNSYAVFPYSEGGTTYNASLSNILPKGLISMWYGSIVSIPSGWALCDGLNGTPDLRERFIVGAGGNNPSVDALSYSVGDTGGANLITLSEAQMPTHNHAVYHHAGWQGPGANTHGAGGGDNFTLVIPGVTSSTGSSQAHENRPPYYALAYIMKL